MDLISNAVYFRAQGTRHARSIPIGTDLARILRRYVRWKKTRTMTEEYFLLRRDCGRLRSDGVYPEYRKLLDTAGVERRNNT